MQGVWLVPLVRGAKSGALLVSRPEKEMTEGENREVQDRPKGDADVHIECFVSMAERMQRTLFTP
jgi:hypothetical protein